MQLQKNCDGGGASLLQQEGFDSTWPWFWFHAWIDFFDSSTIITGHPIDTTKYLTGNLLNIHFWVLRFDQSAPSRNDQWWPVQRCHQWGALSAGGWPTTATFTQSRRQQPAHVHAGLGCSSALLRALHDITLACITCLTERATSDGGSPAAQPTSRRMKLIAIRWCNHGDRRWSVLRRITIDLVTPPHNPPRPLYFPFYRQIQHQYSTATGKRPGRLRRCRNGRT